MAIVGFVKSFLFYFFFALILLAVLLKSIPWTRSRQSWKTHFASVLFAAMFGYAQGVAEVQIYVNSAVDRLNREPDSETAMRSLVGDFLPFMRSLGATPSAQALTEVRRIADKGPACPAAMAQRLLGHTADQEAACRSK